jgi:two-component system, cell cycle response regulator DivK
MVRYMSSKTILFAEDQLDFLAVNKLFLERHGYRVVAAEDGEQAVQAAQECRPDVIVMDFSMPRMDGIRATAVLKTRPETRDIPVLMLTAHSYGSVGRRAREAGCVAVISKPCDPKRVLTEVESLIGSSVH